MPRGRKPKADEAAKLYQQGKSLTDIAKELGVSAGTVRSWKKDMTGIEQKQCLQRITSTL